eukprot:TRINITY_DN13547_c0_g1_i2.p1 TRINITY_DN13547_c0_g1~~TRINITY_DN13547_c0_g1_i2.p1  ORF type:complete len:372 (+),score=105.69 TRINITY_DN13547_c0_g1_i2:102-1118(+)
MERARRASDVLRSPPHSPGGGLLPQEAGAHARCVSPACVVAAVRSLSRGGKVVTLANLEEAMRQWRKARQGHYGFTPALLNTIFLRADKRQAGVLAPAQLYAACHQDPHQLLWQAIVTIGCGTRDIYEALEEGVGETEVLHELRELMEADPSPSPPERPPPSPPRPRTRGGGSAQRAQGRAAPAPPPPAAEVPPTVAVFNREEAAAVVFARAMRDLATGEPPEVPPLQLQWARVEKPRIGKKQQLPPPVHSAAAPAAEDSELRTEAAAQQVDGSIPSRRNPAVVLTAADGSAAGPGQGRRRHTHAAGPAVAAARAKNRSRSTTGSPPRQSVTPPQMAH